MKRKNNKSIQNKPNQAGKNLPQKGVLKPYGKLVLMSAAYQIFAVGMGQANAQDAAFKPVQDRASLGTASSHPAPILLAEAPDVGSGVCVAHTGSGGGGRCFGCQGNTGPSAAEIAAQQQRNEAHNLNEQGIQYWNNQEWQAAADAFKAALDKWPDNATFRDNYEKALEQVQEQEAGRKRQQQEAEARRQAEFEKNKNEALSSMKGVAADSEFGGLKGISTTDNTGLKGMDDSSLQLKDAVADTSAKTLFDKKKASQDLLSANAHGITALDRAASILQGAASNPSLETSLEQAKAETDRRFSTVGKDAGQFNTVVLAGDSGLPQNQPVPVPPEVAKNPHFQKLVVERDALDHQIQLRQKELDGIKSDPDYSKSSTLLTKAYEINNAVETLKTWKKFDDTRITKRVHLEAEDFSDDNPPPAPKNNIDKIVVPPPTH